MSGLRVRFAPSPTGLFHVGSARTALFNWLVARHDPNGVFLLRIEDTDVDRNREEWVDGILSAMAWLGLTFEEGPFRQSDFVADHQAAVTALRDAGHLYFCDCTPGEVATRRGPSAPQGYDGFCRDRNLSQSPRTALRFRTPSEGVTIVHDVIRGDVEFANALLDDFVVAKSSGAVLFALANAVDDRRDRISHVIRGEEHLPNTPKQILLWQALSEAGEAVALPTYAHLPILVNEQRKKLSKRRDPVALELYRDEGYVPEAMMNYLSLLGWSPRGNEEKVPVATCIEEFRLSDVSHSPAFFDVKKLRHLNGEYLRSLALDDFIARCAPWVAPWTTTWRPTNHEPPWSRESFDEELFANVAKLVQERVAVLSEVVSMIDFFFVPTLVFDDDAFDKTIRRDPLAREILSRASDAFGAVTWESEALHEETVRLGDALGWNLRKAQAPIRCAVTGRSVGPPLFESLELLGRDVTLQRLRDALARLD